MKMEQIPLSIYFAMLLILLFFGCKIAKKGSFHEDFLDHSVVKGVQGFAAMGVILHHVTQIATQYGQYNKGFINVMNDAGVLFTALFFFCSGYGLVTSLLTKEDYLKGFLRKRLPAVLVPFYVCNWLFIIVNLVMGARPKPLDLVLYISGLVLLNDQMWFIVELAIFYVVFFLFYRKRKEGKLPLWKMAAALAVMTAVSLFLGHDGLPDSQGLWFYGEWWFNTSWAFLVGMIIAKYKEPVVNFVKKQYVWLMPVIVLATIGLYRATMYMLAHAGYWKEWPGYPGYKEKFLTFCVQCPTVIVFVLMLFVISMKLQFKNRVLSFLGMIALETYLLQNIFITYLRPVIKMDMLFYVGVYACTILLAVLVHKLDQRIIKGIQKKN